MTMPVLKFKTLVNFPAQVYGRTGITVTKTAGAYYLDLDYSVFTPSGPPPADAAVVFYSPINNYLDWPGYVRCRHSRGAAG